MVRGARLAIMAFAFLFALAAGPALAIPYSFSTYQTSQADGTLYAYSIPSEWPACQLKMRAGQFLDSGATVSTNFYSIYGGLLGSQSTGSTNCEYAPAAAIFNGTGGYEITAGLPANSNTTFVLSASCPNINPAYDVLVNGSETDVWGNVPLRAHIPCADLAYISLGECLSYESSQSLAPLQYGYCRNSPPNFPFAPSAPYEFHYTVGVPQDFRMWVYPFNSSAGKISVNISPGSNPRLFRITGDPAWRHIVAVWVLNRNTLATETLFYDTGITDLDLNNITANIENLTQDSDYMLIYGVSYLNEVAPGGGIFIDIYEPSVNISVGMNYPNWSCTAWSECFNGIQNRDCTDLTGQFTDREEIRNCSAAITEQTATLGFETGTGITATTCRPKLGWLGDCVKSQTAEFLYNTSSTWPAGWSVIPSTIFSGAAINPNFATLTNEWATEGTRSLKMWKIPPSLFEPVVVGSLTCDNLTSGLEPSAIRDISNDTMLITYSVTFPSEFATMSLDVRACGAQVEKSPKMSGLLGGCAQDCYSDNCTDINPGNFYFDVRDNETAESFIGGGYYGSVGIVPETKTFTINGLDPARVYRIDVGVSSSSPDSTLGDCVMFDNVKYSTFNEDKVSSITPDCAPVCDGTTYYETQLVNGTCILTTRPDDYRCFAAEAQDSVKAHADFCLNGRLYTFNNKTGKYDNVLTEKCTAEATAANISSGSLGIPADNPMSALNFLVSPMFIAFMICLLLAGLVAVFSKMAVMGLITFIAIAFMFSWVGVFPIALAVAIIVLCAVLIAVMVKNGAFG